MRLHLRLTWMIVIASLIVFPQRIFGQNTVTGTITASGSPVVNGRVTLFTLSLSQFYETRTAANGQYTLNSLPAGTYRLGVAAPRSEYQETGITLSGGTVTRNFTLSPETQAGRWDIVGNTAPEFLDGTDIAILMADGKIFYCHDTADPILFDPVTGAKSFPAGSGLPSGCMNGTLLGDGRLIFFGGQEGEDPGNFRYATRYVRTYSPISNSWTRLADLQYPDGRWYPGLARLANGSLLIMGGGTRPNAARTDTCELFDLATQTTLYTGSMLNACEFPPSALLYTGEVLATWSPLQLYNPTTGQWRLTGNFNQPVRGWPDHSDHSLVILEDGRALALGIRKVGNNNNNVIGEIYNPTTGTWSLTANPGLLRLQPEVVALPDGRILTAAGETQQNPPPVPNVLGVVKWCDLYDPTLNTWRRVADMNQFREYHALALLVPDGRVLMTGGTRIKFQTGPTSADVEAYTPPYLLRGVRPQITAISTTVPSRGNMLQLTIAPQTRLTSVVLMGAGATTHWVDGGVNRRIVLPVNQTGNVATVTLPTDPNILQTGHYLLFAMVDDIPSVAQIINIPNTISGVVTLQQTANAAQTLTFAFRPEGGGTAIVRTQTLTPIGNSQGTFRFTDIPPGRYSLAIKGSKWLQKAVPIDANTGDVSGVTALLLAGDGNGDNFADIADLLLLVRRYNTIRGVNTDPLTGYLDAVDFNSDDANDISDLLLLISNYNRQGDS
jgi:hypothetical protein